MVYWGRGRGGTFLLSFDTLAFSVSLSAYSLLSIKLGTFVELRPVLRAMEKKGLRVNAGKTKIMIAVRAWTSCRVQASFHTPSVALEWAATASSAMAASTGCTKNAVGSSA